MVGSYTGLKNIAEKQVGEKMIEEISVNGTKIKITYKKIVMSICNKRIKIELKSAPLAREWLEVALVSSEELIILLREQDDETPKKVVIPLLEFDVEENCFFCGENRFSTLEESVENLKKITESFKVSVL